MGGKKWSSKPKDRQKCRWTHKWTVKLIKKEKKIENESHMGKETKDLT